MCTTCIPIIPKKYQVQGIYSKGLLRKFGRNGTIQVRKFGGQKNGMDRNSYFDRQSNQRFYLLEKLKRDIEKLEKLGQQDNALA